MNKGIPELVKSKPSLIVLMILVVVLSASCNDSNLESGSQRQAVNQSGSESADGDPYQAFLAADILSINSALRELEYRCYAADGYREYLDTLPEQKSNEFRSMASTPDFATTFASFAELPWFPSEESARETGYGHNLAGLDATVFGSDPAFADVMKQCHDSSLAAISGSDDLISDYTLLGNALAEVLAVTAGEIRDPLTKKVFECMSKGKFPTDPNGPNKNEQWGVDFGVALGSQPQTILPPMPPGLGTHVLPAVPAQKYVPAATESESAAAMYQCSVDTGAHDDWLRAMNDAKSLAYTKHEASLTELSPQIRDLAKSASAAVQAMG